MEENIETTIVWGSGLGFGVFGFGTSDLGLVGLLLFGLGFRAMIGL